MEKQEISEKIYRYLIELYDNHRTKLYHEILIHSKIYVQNFYPKKRLIFIIHPEIYKKYDTQLDSITKDIRRKIKQITNASFNEIHYIPDWNKFQILNNQIKTIVTPWEEINEYQEKLNEQLKTAEKPIDYQNIGNTSRTLMQKLARIVYNENIHKAPESIEVSDGKFKNRLHTYIKSELGGSSNKELRDYAVSLITTTEKSIDLSNKLTHDLDADNLMAESCVMSTITAIGLIRMIENTKTTHNKSVNHK
jgi:hypothetical protein